MIRDAFPSMEKVRLVSSGTEAVMSAIRVARGFTKRDSILKFEGCYHGHSDYLLAKAGSGLATLGIPDSLGVPADFAKHTLTVPYNNIQAVQQIVKEHRNTLACIILEPIAANMGVVPPAPDFLAVLRRLTQRERHPSDFRRGDLRLSCGLRRSPNALRHYPGSDGVGENHRRWIAGRRLRRAERDHGSDRAVGAGLSGGDVVGKSVSRIRRH